MKKIIKLLLFLVISSITLFLLFVTTQAKNNQVKFENVCDVSYPYIDAVKDYYEAPFNVGVKSFVTGETNYQYKGTTISWTFDGQGLLSFEFAYSTNENFDNAIIVNLPNTSLSYTMTNLLKGTKYFIKITAITDNGNSSDISNFYTTTLGARFLDISGTNNNFRDIGGYETNDGIITEQNLLIRGSAIDAGYDDDDYVISQDEYNFLNDTLGIKTEVELRGASEDNSRRHSVLTNANFVKIPLVQYKEAFSPSQASLYCDFFKLLADRSNYPIYFHCAAGADRTGTLAIILESLLNYKYEDIIQDYEVTSFTSCGLRDRYNVELVLSGLANYGGKTIQENAENYLLAIGLTRQEINNIKAIFFGFDENSFPFEDVTPNKYYYDAACWAKEKNILQDNVTNIFNPNTPVDRGELVYLLWKKSSCPIVNIKTPFVDINENDYYYNAVCWAYANNITVGTSPNTFSPNDISTRSQVLTMIWKNENSPIYNSENIFDDINSSSYYYNAVVWATRLGYANGMTANLFKPSQSCTRAQVTQFLYKASRYSPNMPITRAQAIYHIWKNVGSPKIKGTTPFVDISEKDYYYDAVVWAYNECFTYGTSSNTFSPNELCSKAQAITLVWLANYSFESSGYSRDTFCDVPENAWYAKAVWWAANEGYITCDESGLFAPYSDCKYEQFLYWLSIIEI